MRVNNFWSNNYIKYESNADSNKTLSVKEYLNKIIPYSKHIINNLKKSDAWKNQLTIAYSFISSTDNVEGRVMYLKNDNIGIMINDEVDEVLIELFDSLQNRYQYNLESMKGSEFVFDYAQLLYYKCREINANRSGSYIDFPDWINHINKKDNKFLQYDVTIALNH